MIATASPGSPTPSWVRCGRRRREWRLLPRRVLAPGGESDEADDRRPVQQTDRIRHGQEKHRGSGLAARGSGLGARGSMSEHPSCQRRAVEGPLTKQHQAVQQGHLAGRCCTRARLPAGEAPRVEDPCATASRTRCDCAKDSAAIVPGRTAGTCRRWFAPSGRTPAAPSPTVHRPHERSRQTAPGSLDAPSSTESAHRRELCPPGSVRIAGDGSRKWRRSRRPSNPCGSRDGA